MTIKTIYLIMGVSDYEDAWPIRAFTSRKRAEEFLQNCFDRQGTADTVDLNAHTYTMTDVRMEVSP